MLLQHSVENAEQLIKRLESFITTTMDANDDRINSVVALGRQLIDENNYASDKIQQKADSLEDRCYSDSGVECTKLVTSLKTLQQQLLLSAFLWSLWLGWVNVGYLCRLLEQDCCRPNAFANFILYFVCLKVF